MIDKKLCSKLKQVRKELKCTQADFSVMLKTKRNSIAMIETGRNGCTVELLSLMFRELKVNPVWFFLDQGDMFSYQTILSSCDGKNTVNTINIAIDKAQVCPGSGSFDLAISIN